MTTLPVVNAHFDGKVIVPEVPLPLVPGERVRVTIEREEVAKSSQPRREAGSAKQECEAVFSSSPDMTAALVNGDDWDENAVLHVDPLERVPTDFVRKPGSGAGEIKMAEDFDTTPPEFEEYL